MITDEDARDCLQKLIDATYPDDGDKSGLFFLLTDWLTRAVGLHPTSQAILDHRREWAADKPPALIGAIHLAYRDAGFPNTTPAVVVPKGWVKTEEEGWSSPCGCFHVEGVGGGGARAYMEPGNGWSQSSVLCKTLPEAFAAAERMHAVWGGGE